MVWKITFTTLGDTPECNLFIMHVGNSVMGATPMGLCSFKKCNLRLSV